MSKIYDQLQLVLYDLSMARIMDLRRWYFQMKFSIYIVGWSLVFATATPSGNLLKNRLGQMDLPSWLRGHVGLRYAFFSGLVAIIASISTLCWAVLNLKWYGTFFGFIVGLIVSGFIQKVVSPGDLISLGPAFLLLSNTLLWFAKSNY